MVIVSSANENLFCVICSCKKRMLNIEIKIFSEIIVYILFDLC